MDAKLRKALSGISVAVMMMTVFSTVFIGTASAVGTASRLEITPKTGIYQDVLTLDVVNATANAKVYLCSPWFTNPATCISAGGNASRDVTSAGTARFSSITVNQVGTWHVVDQNAPSTSFTGLSKNDYSYIANLTVNPKTLGIVGLVPSSLTFTKGAIQTVSGVVQYNATGAAVNGTATGAKVRMYFPDNVTSTLSATLDATGHFSFPDVAIGDKGAGVYRLVAFIDTNADSVFEASGTSGFTVSSNALQTGLSKKTDQLTPVFGFGSRKNAVLNLTYPEDGTVVDVATGVTQAGAACTAPYTGCVNITVIAPGGARTWLDDARTFGVATGNKRLTVTLDAAAGKVSQLNITSFHSTANPAWNGTGDLGTGDYQVFVKFNRRAGPHWAATTWKNPGNWEYQNTVAYTFNIAKASTVNVDATMSPTTVQPRDGTGAPGTVSITMNIYGQTDSEYPGATVGTPCGSTCPPAFLNVTGAVLAVPGATWPLALSGGQSHVRNVVIAAGSSNVRAEISWRGTTKTFDFTTSNASNVASVDVASVTVDTNSKVIITAKDAFGNPIPNAKVTLFWLNNPTVTSCTNGPSLAYCTISSTLNGTGEPGKGQNGQYQFTVTQSVIGTVGVIVQDQPALTAAFRFAYSSFSVTRAHDLTTKVNITKTTTGVPTEIKVNVTNPAGKSVTGALVYIFEKSAYETFAKAFALNPNVAVTGHIGTALPETTTKGDYRLLKTDSAMVSGFAKGDYRIFVKNNTHDNVGLEGTFTVADPTLVFNGSRISSQFLPDAKILVTVRDANGAAIAGTLRAEFANTLANCGADAAGCTYGAQAGRANFWGGNITSSALANTTGGALPTTVKVVTFTVNSKGEAWFYATGTGNGAINWSFAPSTQTTAKQYGNAAQLLVVGPTVSITPTRIPQGVPSTLALTVTDLNGKPLANLYVALCGTPISTTTGCTDALQTDASGQVNGLGITPSAIGLVTARVASTAAGTLAVANASSATVTVYSGMQLVTTPGAPQVGETVTILVTKIAPGNPSLSGARIVVKNPAGAEVANKTSDASGAITFVPSAEGTYTVRATLAGYDAADATLVVSAAKPVHVPKADIQGSNLRLSASSIKLGESVTVTLDLKNVGDADGTAVLKLKADGATVQTVTDLVKGNNGTDTVAYTFTPTAAKQYTLTVEVDGKTLPTQTLTVTGVTPPTPTGPTGGTGGTPSTTPSKPDGIPGFEVLAALGALGIAVLVLRRRS